MCVCVCVCVCYNVHTLQKIGVQPMKSSSDDDFRVRQDFKAKTHINLQRVPSII